MRNTWRRRRGGTVSPVGVVATQLGIVTQPSAAPENGVNFSVQPIIELRDTAGNAVAQAGVTVTASLQSGAGTLGGTLTAVMAGNGRATFTNLKITGLAGDRTIIFRADPISPITSATVSIIAAAVVLSIADTTYQNQTAAVSTNIPFAPAIQVVDQSGNPRAGVDVVFAVVSGGGIISSPTTVPTNGAGWASLASWTLGSSAGTNNNTVTATATDVAGSPVTFTATATAVAPPPAPEPGTGTPLVVRRWDGVSGTMKVSSSIQLTPGMVFPSTLNKVRIYDITAGQPGVEAAIAIIQLYGQLYPDGSLGEIGVQLVRDITNNTPYAYEMRVGTTTRATTDLTWVEPIYSSANMNIPAVTHRGVIAPTDPIYMCKTRGALCSISPHSQDVETPRYFGPAVTDFYGSWANELKLVNVDAPCPGASQYEHVQGFWVEYMRTGDFEFYKMAYDRFIAQMAGTLTTGSGSARYFLPNSGGGGDQYAKITTIDPSMGAPPFDGMGMWPESNTGMGIGWAVSYRWTAWKQPWRMICMEASYTLTTTTTYAAARQLFMGSNWGMRQNMTRFAYWQILAYELHATMQVSAPNWYGAGRNPARSFITELQWLIDAMYEWRFQTATYTNGITGQTQGATGGDPGDPAGTFPTFQLQIVAKVLILYYNVCPPDARIPVFIKTMADFVIGEHGVGAGGLYYADYKHNGVPGGASTYWINFFPEILGFAFAETGLATYKTWCLRACNGAQLSGFQKNFKAMGEYGGGHLFSGSHWINGGALRPANLWPSAWSEPIVHTS